jgi:hypothetical protein
MDVRRSRVSKYAIHLPSGDHTGAPMLPYLDEESPSFVLSHGVLAKLIVGPGECDLL